MGYSMLGGKRRAGKGWDRRGIAEREDKGKGWDEAEDSKGEWGGILGKAGWGVAGIGRDGQEKGMMARKGLGKEGK